MHRLRDGRAADALCVQIGAYGAEIVHVDDDERRSRIRALTDEGWLPATSSDPALSGAGNPYGLDGYAAIAGEIIDALGYAPAIVCVPVASGDLLAASRADSDTTRRSAGGRSSSLASRWRRRHLPRRSSRAVPSSSPSTHRSLARPSDASTGRLALAAVRDDCALVTVEEERIVEATRRLAREGLYVETSSALALAGIEEARARGIADADSPAVAILTATGRGWSEEVDSLFNPSRPARAANATGSHSRQG